MYLFSLWNKYIKEYKAFSDNNPNTFRMWSKTFKPGDGKVKRDVAMSAQVVQSGKSQIPEYFHPGPTDPEEKSRDRGQDGGGG